MRRRLRAAGVSALMLALGGTALASSNSQSPRNAPKPAASPAKPPKQKKAKTHKLSGIIEAYDSLLQTLTLKTSKGSVVFSTVTAKVWSNSKSVAVDQLGGSVGARATVAYLEKDGEKRATAVHFKPPSSKPPTEVSVG